MYPLFHCCWCPHPVCGCFVHDGSAPPALAAVIVDYRPFGRAVGQRRQRQHRGRASSSGGQSIPNINCTIMSLLCLWSLLVSIIVVVGVVLLKCPSQSRCSGTSRNRTCTLPLPHWCCHHRRPLSRRCCHCCPPNPPAQ